MAEIGIDVEAFSQVHLEYKEDLTYFFLTWIQSTNEKKLDFNSEAFKSAIFPFFNTWENCQFQNFGIICSKINPGMVEKIYDSEGNVFIKDIKDMKGDPPSRGAVGWDSLLKSEISLRNACPRASKI